MIMHSSDVRQIAPQSVRLERVLPAKPARVWDYLTRSDLRRQWLASGEMTLEVGAPFEFVWRNDELTIPPGERPAGFAAEQRMASRIIAVEPPHRLVIGWGDEGDVTFEIAPFEDRALLTITHRRLQERGMRLMVSAGWHAHVDILDAALSGAAAAPFWSNWLALRDRYDGTLPAN